MVNLILCNFILFYFPFYVILTTILKLHKTIKKHKKLILEDIKN